MGFGFTNSNILAVTSSFFLSFFVASSISKESQQGRGLDISGGDADSVNSVEMGSNHSGSTVGTPTIGTPTLGTPKMKRPSFQQQRERLYRAGPEQYIVTQDVEAQQPGDLTLCKGMAVEGKVWIKC